MNRNDLWDWADVAAAGIIARWLGENGLGLHRGPHQFRNVADLVTALHTARWVIDGGYNETQRALIAAGVRHGAREEHRRWLLAKRRRNNAYDFRTFVVDAEDTPCLGDAAYSFPNSDRLVSRVRNPGGVKLGIVVARPSSKTAVVAVPKNIVGPRGLQDGER